MLLSAGVVCVAVSDVFVVNYVTAAVVVVGVAGAVGVVGLIKLLLWLPLFVVVCWCCCWCSCWRECVWLRVCFFEDSCV